MLAAGRAGVNIYDASSGVGSLPGAIPGQGTPAPDYISGALSGAENWIATNSSGPMSSALIGAATDTYNLAAKPIAAVGAGISFLTDIPRVAVTATGFLLLAAGVFMLGRGQIAQFVKP